MTDQQAIERVVAQVEEQLGPVELLVNNAGVPAPVAPLWETDPDVWWYCINVSVRGPFLCSRAVLPRMLARRRGRIIHTASEYGLKPVSYASGYATGKAAAIRLSENLAAEVKEHGISVFAMDPGGVRTAMVEAVAAEPGDEIWWGGAMRGWLEKGDSNPPERGADLAALLASGQADALSGCLISVDDDLSDMVWRAAEIRRDELYTLRLRT